MNQCSDGLWSKSVREVAGWAEIKNDNRDLIIHAEAKSRGVHNAESVFQAVLKGNGFETFGIWIFTWVAAVNAIDLCSFKYDIGSHFTGAKGGCGVGGEERTTGSSCKDNNGFCI